MFVETSQHLDDEGHPALKRQAGLSLCRIQQSSHLNLAAKLVGGAACVDYELTELSGRPPATSLGDICNNRAGRPNQLIATREFTGSVEGRRQSCRFASYLRSDLVYQETSSVAT